MTQEEYDKIEERLRKGYDLRQTIAIVERNLNTILSARKETDNYLPEVHLEWAYAYHMEGRVELSDEAKRKILDLVTDDLVERLEKLKKQFNEL